MKYLNSTRRRWSPHYLPLVKGYRSCCYKRLLLGKLYLKWRKDALFHITRKTGKNWGIRKLKESCTTGADCSNSWMSVQAVAKTSNSSQDSSKIYQRLSNIVKELQSSRRKINHRLPMLQCSPKETKGSQRCMGEDNPLSFTTTAEDFQTHKKCPLQNDPLIW